jgi:prepilin-type N-terminal cleavage/methylation domain-containing protein
MRFLGSTRNRKKQLCDIASRQYGYFSYKQLLNIGYSDKHHKRDQLRNSWLKISTGLFRLPNYSDSMESDFTKWCLWSRNQQDQPQGVICHHSALALHGFADYNPKEVHLTVPVRFRKEIPDEVIIHKASLPLSAIESHGSFMITRLGQTLFDMRQKLEAQDEWEVIIEKVVAEGRLSWGDAINLGFVSSSKMGSDNNLGLEPSSGQEALGVFKQNTEQIEAHLSKGRMLDPVSEGVWKMMSDRAEFGSRASKAGFTLVELLVVVAIISILASLLMPMLRSALETARQMVCLNNSKQICIGINAYADDYRRLSPAGIAVPNFLYNFTTRGGIANYLGVGKEYDGGGVKGTGTPPIARCPNGGRYGHANFESVGTNPNWSICTNQYLVDVYSANFKKVRNASSRMLAMDGGIDNWNNLSTNVWHNGFRSRGMVAFRHNQKASAVFFDAHTETLAYDDVPKTYLAADDPDDFWMEH